MLVPMCGDSRNFCQLVGSTILYECVVHKIYKELVVESKLQVIGGSGRTKRSIEDQFENV